MTKEEIIKGNELIAKFMGLYMQVGGQYMSYHLLWDTWLMPVVERIEAIKDSYHGHFGVHIVSNTCCIQSTEFRPNERIPEIPHYFVDTVAATKIEAAWISIIKFITWYNEQGRDKETSS